MQYLIHEKWLEMTPGIGTSCRSSCPPHRLKEMRGKSIQNEIAALIAEARRIGLSPEELQHAIDKEWKKARGFVEVGR